MATAADTPAFQALAGRLQTDERTRDCLAAWAAELYALSGNFMVLHMVTASRALRVLAPWVDDAPGAMWHVVRAYVAALLASGVSRELAAPVSHSDGGPPPTWPQVIAAAIASDDDHIIKFVHACAEEKAVLPGPSRVTDPRTVPPWLSAAARAVGGSSHAG